MNATQSEQEACDDTSLRIAPRRARIDPAHENRPQTDQSIVAEDASTAELPQALDAVEAGRAMLEVVEEPTEEMLGAVAGQTLDARREQLQLQVSQLASHLRERLRDVDRREAQLNARVAQLEGDLRASRMWLRERETEFQERENELRRQIEELQERTALPQIADNESDSVDVRACQAELNDREQQLILRENEVRERRFEVERQAAALRHAQQLWEQQRAQQQRALADEREQLDKEFLSRTEERDELLHSAEAILDEHSRQLDQDRAALLAERQAWEAKRAREQQTIDIQKQAAEGECTDCQTRLEARQDWIERQKASLEQVRGEILALHRQSLEMRLLAEQLWSEISGRLAPAEVTHSIAQLRLKLAEQYRLEEQGLQARRDELVQLGERIAEQHRELTQLRTGLRDWAAARQSEIESQAASLVQRELALDAQQEACRHSQHEWQADRRRYEQQIRDLASQLRALPAAA